MEINQVKFGNYSIGTAANGTAKKNSKQAGETDAQTTQSQTSGKANPEGILDALGIAGMQNLAFISKSEVQAPNPSDFLSQERISDIEASMAEFEAGVNNIVNVLDGEFPGLFDDEQKYALAANIFAAE